MRDINIGLTNILSLVECATDYGYARDVFFAGMANFIGYTLTEEEIDEYLKDEGVVNEDYDSLITRRDRLIAFKTTYCS